jgi:hypothetical protein
MDAEILPPPGFDLRTAQPVASRYTEYDIPALQSLEYTSKYIVLDRDMDKN